MCVNRKDQTGMGCEAGDGDGSSDCAGDENAVVGIDGITEQLFVLP